MRSVMLPGGERVPAFGLGTWHMGESGAKRAAEVEAIRYGLDLGVRLLDTAEMYGEGIAEEIVAEAIEGRRDEVFLVSKVYPHNASRKGALAACERSLERLKTDRIDLYLLHWRGSVPFAETMAAFVKLKESGKILHYGVSNLDRADMEEVAAVAGGSGVQTNQVLYSLARRGIEWDLLPWLRARRIPVMAYSPIEQGRLLKDGRLVAFARTIGITPAQAALAWLLKDEDVVVIPKSSHAERVKENFAALDVRLTPEQLAELDGVAGGSGVQTNQVLYSLARRGIEWDLLPWLRERRIPVMAYAPIDQGRILKDARLVAFARKLGITPAQAALAWLLKDEDVIVIPKSSHTERVQENFGALDVRLTEEQVAALDAIFPPPKGPRALEML